VLFGNADIEGAGRVRLGELVHPGAARHGSGDRADALVRFRQLRQRQAEHVLIGGGRGRALGLFAGDDVELGHAVILVGRVFCRGIALALLGDDMDQHRAFGGVTHILQHGEQVIQIVPVDRADVIEAQFFEQSPAGHHAAGEFFRLADGVMHPAAQLFHGARGEAADAEILGARNHARKVGRKPAHRRRDRHVVIIEYYDKPIARLRGVVHRFVGHAGAHRAVTDHRDPAPRLALKLVGDGKAQRGRDRGRGVRRAEGIVFALRTLGEARKPAALTQRADAVTPPGDDLVRVALVAHVPHQLVVRRVEDIMDRDSQFDHAEAGAKVPARCADGVDHFGAQFIGQLAELFGLEAAQVVGSVDEVEQRRVRRLIHNVQPYTRKTRVSIEGLRWIKCAGCGALASCGLTLQAQALHSPRISSTGRSALKSRAAAIARTARLTSSSSTWAASPHSSQTRKMQSCAQPGWVLAR